MYTITPVSNPSKLSATAMAVDINSSSFTLVWSTSGISTRIAGFKISLDGGQNYVDVGNVLCAIVSGLNPKESVNCKVIYYNDSNVSTDLFSTVVTAAATSTTSDIICNSSGTPLVNARFKYTYFPANRIGSVNTQSCIEGEIFSDTVGRVIFNNLPVGTGILLLSLYNNADPEGFGSNTVYYELVTTSP